MNRLIILDKLQIRIIFQSPKNILYIIIYNIHNWFTFYIILFNIEISLQILLLINRFKL